MPRSRPMTVIAALLLLTSACVPILPTPDDFPPPPWTPIVEFPTPAAPPTATLAPRLRPILPSDMGEARTLFLLTQVAITAGDSGLVAERVLYPITVDLDGRPTTISSASSFEEAYPTIFHGRLQDAILRASEDDLVLMPDGIRAADGALWFNLYCVDPACTESRFLITRINN
ncbi:MAG TPA: hypothetical protein VIU38_08530 [Anaerolineales bacterium]